MEYNLIRSKRKTLVIKILPDKTVMVKAPSKLSLQYINNFVNSKKEWIQKRQHLMQKNTVEIEKYSQLKQVLIFGNIYTIEEFISNFINSNSLKKPLIINANTVKKFLVQLANSYILERTMTLAKELSLAYNGAKIMSSRRNWGSCNSLKQLRFNFRLVMLPKQLIDYVICHELCHLKQMNHSKDFWKLLENLGYKKTEVKQQFKNFSFVLQLF